MDRLLIVDDEVSILELMDVALADESRELVLAASVTEALAKIDKCGPVDLAIVDKNLPDGNGLSLLRELSKKYPEHEAILITGYATLESAIEAVDLKLFDYMQKPVDLERLESKIEAALAKVRLRREQQARLAHVHRVQALGVLAASIGHEINNPLSYVIGNIDISRELLRDKKSDLTEEDLAELEDMLSDALKGGQRIRGIVRDLRISARNEPEEEIENFHLEAAMQTALSLVNHQLRHRARLEVDLVAPPEIAGSQLRLGQVFTNLLINATQSFEDRPASQNVITVKTGVDESGWAFASVQDNGIGIPQENFEKIFDRFWTSKQDLHGSGLGLAISKRYVVSMDGTIDVESKVGEGSTFTVRLPSAKSMEKSKSQRISVPHSAESARVLIIDDDQFVGKLLTRSLTPPHEVVVVPGVEAAIALLKDDRNFDVILCDFMMPDGTGMDVYDKLVQIDKKVASDMIFMTGGAFTTRTISFMESTSNRVLEKPLSVADVRALISGRTSRK